VARLAQSRRRGSRLSGKFLAFINASAGTAKARGKEDLRALLSEIFGQHGIEAELRFPHAEELPHVLKQARECAVDGILVGGGDGTIRTAAGVLAGSGTPLGVLPLGTLNHFAKDLGLPLKLEDTIGVFAAGHVRSIDVGTVNGEIFINNSSIGIYPFLVLDRERMQEEEGKQKWHAALLAGFRALKKFPVRKLRVQVEGETIQHRTPIIFIGNNAYGLDLGTVGKRERLDGGELSIHVAKTESREGFLLLVLRAMFGRLRTSRDLQVLHGSFAEVTSRTSRLPVALDGEVEILQPPLRYEIRKQALKVFVPKEEA
jgi:diacylglycerol kinase family enzyme